MTCGSCFKILRSEACRPSAGRALRASLQAALTVSSTDTPPVLGTWTKSTCRESEMSTRRGYPTADEVRTRLVRGLSASPRLLW